MLTSLLQVAQLVGFCFRSQPSSFSRLDALVMESSHVETFNSGRIDISTMMRKVSKTRSREEIRKNLFELLFLLFALLLHNYYLLDIRYNK